VKKGPDINACDKKRKIPLIRAEEYRDAHIIKILVDYGADLYVKDKQGLIAADYVSTKKTGNILKHAGAL